MDSSSLTIMLTGSCHDRIAHVSQLCRSQSVNVKRIGRERDGEAVNLTGSGCL